MFEITNLQRYERNSRVLQNKHDWKIIAADMKFLRKISKKIKWVKTVNGDRGIGQ